MKMFSAMSWTGPIHRTEYVTNKVIGLHWRSEDGEPLAMLTANLDALPAEGCVWLKTYSENEMLNLDVALVEQGFGELTGVHTISGYCSFPEFRLNMEAFSNS